MVLLVIKSSPLMPVTFVKTSTWPVRESALAHVLLLLIIRMLQMICFALMAWMNLSYICHPLEKLIAKYKLIINELSIVSIFYW